MEERDPEVGEDRKQIIIDPQTGVPVDVHSGWAKSPRKAQMTRCWPERS